MSGRDNATGAALRALVSRPLRATVIALLIGAVFAGTLAWYIGLDTGHAAAVTIAIIVVGVALLCLPDLEATSWWHSEKTEDDGARNDVTRLSWSLRTKRGRVRPEAVRRVRTLAASRLRPFELDIDDPEDRHSVEVLIGARAYRSLRPEPPRTPYFGDVKHTLDALESLVNRTVSPSASTTNRKSTP